MSAGGPAGGDLLGAIEAVDAAGPGDRFTAVWRILLGAPDRDGFAVALDLAMERGLVPMEVGALLQGRWDAQGPAPTWVNPVDGSEMVWVAPGPFLAGEPRRRAEAPGFFLARHPVTNAQFAKFLDETGYQGAPDPPDAPALFPRGYELWLTQGGREIHPVVGVSFVDALAYCRWAGLGLPSEWHWEKAARGPDGRTFPWGEANPYGYSPRAPKLAQVRADDTCPVGSFPKTRTPYGCEDLVGNVSEWCWESLPGFERHVPSELGAPDPKDVDPGSYAVLRGSAYLRRQPSRMGSAHRRRLRVTARNRWVGFRPAFYPDPGPPREPADPVA